MQRPQNEPSADVCVFLLQLGGPKDLQSIAPFLRNLFEDVLPLPSLLRRPLARFIAWRRAPAVRPLYAEIGGGSPLLPNTEAQATALQAQLAAMGVKARVLVCMRYAPPRAAEVVVQARETGAVPWVALSLYPHYSFATSRSSLRELQDHLTPEEQARFRAVCAYPEDGKYIEALALGIENTLASLPAEVRDKVHLVFSAHGLPVSLVREGDPYPTHIEATVKRVLQALKRPMPHTLCYQSRVGPTKWLEPSTPDSLKKLGAQGVRHVAVIPVAFTSEHIETLHELDIQLRDMALVAGIETYVRVPTVGIEALFIEALAHKVTEAIGRHSRCCGAFAGCELRADAQAAARAG